MYAGTLSERMYGKLVDAVIVSGEGQWMPGRWGQASFPSVALCVLWEF